jgi:hypothetical protein
VAEYRGFGSDFRHFRRETLFPAFSGPLENRGRDIRIVA